MRYFLGALYIKGCDGRFVWMKKRQQLFEVADIGVITNAFTGYPGGILRLHQFKDEGDIATPAGKFCSGG